jgi:hypothetical protein
MQKLLLLLLSLSLFSCITEKQRLKICNSCATKTDSKDSVSVVEHWDTVKLAPIAGPVQYLENPCKTLCDSLGRLIPFKNTQTKNGIKSTVKSVGNSIVIECETDSLKAYIQVLKEKYTFSRKHDAEVKFLPCKNERTRFDGFAYWWFFITAGLILLVTIVIVVRGYIKNFTVKKFL